MAGERERPLAALCLRAGAPAVSGGGDVTRLELAELEALRAELERRLPGEGTPRWNADPEEVQRSVVQLVLTLVDFIRKLLERQAIRRLEAGTLEADEGGNLRLALTRPGEAVPD